MDIRYRGTRVGPKNDYAVAAELLHGGQVYRMASLVAPGYENNPKVVYKHCRRLQNALFAKAGIKKWVDFLTYEGQTEDDFIFAIAGTNMRARVSKRQYADIRTARQAARFVVLQLYRGM